MDLEKIGKFIAECRKEKDLTQEQLANKLGLTAKAISKWECGNGLPDVSVMLKLCETLGINIMDLLSGEVTNIKLYKRRTEGTMIKRITLDSALKELKNISNVCENSVLSINEINEKRKNVTFKVIIKGIDAIETENYCEVTMEVEDETGEMSAILLSKINEEIKEVIKNLSVGNCYLMQGFITLNEEVFGDKLLIIRAIKKI